MYKASITIIITAIMLSACSSVNISEDIRGTEWEAISIEGKALEKAELMNGLPTLTFGNDGVLTGSTSCNKFSGSYKMDGTNISLQPGAMTKMFCPGGTEQDFLNAISKIRNLTFENEMLLLQDGSDLLIKLVPKKI